MADVHRYLINFKLYKICLKILINTLFVKVIEFVLKVVHESKSRSRK